MTGGTRRIGRDFGRHSGSRVRSGTIIPALDCRPFRTSKSGLLFPPDQPPPDALIAAIVTARLAENAAGPR